MTKPIKLPPRSRLLYLFSYNGKYLIWKNPPKNKQFLRGKRAGTKEDLEYNQVKFDGIIYKVHRVIFKMLTGREPPQIDHKNRKRGDNRKRNLLPSDAFKNHRNRSDTVFPNMPSGVGPWRGRYRAWITINYKAKYLGMFSSKAAAAAAHRNARRERDG